MQIICFSGGDYLHCFHCLGLREGEYQLQRAPTILSFSGRDHVWMQSCRISRCLGFCLVGHVELNKGGEHLFVCKPSYLLLLILLLILGISYSVPVSFSKLSSQAMVFAFVPLSPDGLHGEGEQLLLSLIPSWF